MLLKLKLIIALAIITCEGVAMAARENKVNPSRLILSKVRGGDYAHAGDTEAIDMILEMVTNLDPHITYKPTLDVGCGFGGTADYLYTRGFQNVQGIDVDGAAIEYAQANYPIVPFIELNALELSKAYPADHFGFVYLLNVAYAIEDKENLLKNLSAVTRPKGILVLFDYAHSSVISKEMKDLANKPMYPIRLNEIKTQLQGSGWETIEVVDMTHHYIRWYKDLLKKLDAQYTQLSHEFSVQDVVKVKATFTYLLEKLEKNQMQGVVIYAKKK